MGENYTKKQLLEKLHNTKKQLILYEQVIINSNISNLTLGINLMHNWCAYASSYSKYIITMSIFTPERVKYEMIKCNCWVEAVDLFTKFMEGDISENDMANKSYNVYDLENNKRLYRKDISITEWLL